MAKLNIFMNIYEEFPHIEHSIKSAAKIAKKFYILDGTVKLFPAKPDYNSYAEVASSRDGTLELVKELLKKLGAGYSIYESTYIWESEHLKKNWLLDKIPEGEWVLQLDGDEQLYLTNEALALLQRMDDLKEETFDVPIIFHADASFKEPSRIAFLQPRIWRNSRNRRFRPPSKEQLVRIGSYSSLPVDPEVKRPVDPVSFSGEQELLKRGGGLLYYGSRAIFPLFILNNPAIRNVERQKRRLIYYERLFGIKFL